MAYSTNTLNVCFYFLMLEIYLRLKKHQVDEKNSLQNTNKISKSRDLRDEIVAILICCKIIYIFFFYSKLFTNITIIPIKGS